MVSLGIKLLRLGWAFAACSGLIDRKKSTFERQGLSTSRARHLGPDFSFLYGLLPPGGIESKPL